MDDRLRATDATRALGVERAEERERRIREMLARWQAEPVDDEPEWDPAAVPRLDVTRTP